MNRIQKSFFDTFFDTLLTSFRSPIRLFRGITLATLAITSTLVLADPPEGKGKNKHRGHDDDYSQQRDRYDDDYDDHRGHGKHGKHDKHDKHRGYDDDQGHRDASVNINISFGEVRQIADRHRYSGYSSLPPGIRKNLARGKPLPPGIAMKRVPPDMLRDLPVYPGYEWRIYGSDLILYAATRQLVHEVYRDIFH